MSSTICGLIDRAEAVLLELGHAQSTRWQYRWAWNRVAEHCRENGADRLTDEVVASFLEVVAAEFQAGRLKEWKRKLLRKSVLVLAEIHTTGTYQWKFSRQSHPNDALGAVFRPVQEQFEAWLSGQVLSQATRDLYATVSRRTHECLTDRHVSDVERVSGVDVTAVLVHLGGSYGPSSMRTVLTAVRVWCRFLESEYGCQGLLQAVIGQPARRSRVAIVVPCDRVEQVVNSPDAATSVGRRNRAMLLLGARMGLRPIDIVRLRLGDVDWRQGKVTVVQHKTGRVVMLPLLQEVGDAIVDYLFHGRPINSAQEHVFLRAQAPFVALSASDLYHVASRAFARTALTPNIDQSRGFRVLRASLATRMLTEGVPLPVIAGALGHAGIVSVKHYLSADEQGLRACCLDFAGIEAGSVRS